MDKLIYILVGVLVIAAIIISIQEEKDWNKFKVEHNCKVTGVVDGHWAFGMTSNGNAGDVFIPGSKTYMCDDGISYTKTE